MQIVTRRDLDRGKCSHPDCKDPSCDELYLHQSCHPDAGCQVIYKKKTGVVELVCQECGRDVVGIQLQTEH